VIYWLYVHTKYRKTNKTFLTICNAAFSIDPWRDDPEVSSSEECECEGVGDGEEDYDDENCSGEEGESDLNDEMDIDSVCVCGKCKFDDDPDMPNKCCGKESCLSMEQSGKFFFVVLRSWYGFFSFYTFFLCQSGNFLTRTS
jgi:hypothetical protein